MSQPLCVSHILSILLDGIFDVVGCVFFFANCAALLQDRIVADGGSGHGGREPVGGGQHTTLSPSRAIGSRPRQFGCGGGLHSGHGGGSCLPEHVLESYRTIYDGRHFASLRVLRNVVAGIMMLRASRCCSKAVS